MKRNFSICSNLVSYIFMEISILFFVYLAYAEVDAEEVFPSSVHNVTVLIYGIPYASLQQTLPYTSAGFDVGVRYANRQYNGSVLLRSVYVENSGVVSCEDTGTYFDSVSEYYYRQKNRSESIVIMYPGSFI